MTFLMAATAGLLIFLGLDTLVEALEVAADFETNRAAKARTAMGIAHSLSRSTSTHYIPRPRPGRGIDALWPALYGARKSPHFNTSDAQPREKSS